MKSLVCQGRCNATEGEGHLGGYSRNHLWLTGRISFDLDKYFHTRNAREKDGPCLRFAEVELLRPDAVQSDLLLVPFGIYVHIYATHAEDTGMNKQLMVHEHWISRIFAERNLYLVPESAQSLQ